MIDLAVWFAAAASILAATWRTATPLLYAALGETFTELSGVLNIGLEGVMLIGAFTGFAVGLGAANLYLGVMAAALSGVVCGLVFAWFTVTRQANQIIVGTAINFIGAGLTALLFRTFFARNLGLSAQFTSFPPLNLPGLSDLPFFGEVLFSHNWMVYAAVALVPLAGLALYRTAFGLALRSVGEHPRAAETAGISVRRIRYLGILIGTTLAALGGAYLTMAYTNQFAEEIASGRGFIALAVVVFGRWRPRGVLLASLLFGVFYALQLRLQGETFLPIPYQFFQMLPYLATVLVLVGLRGQSNAPKALAVPYS